MAPLAASSRADRIAGMTAMALAALLLPVGDAISKALTGLTDPMSVTVWRTVTQAFVFLPVALVLRRRLSGSVLSAPALLSAALVLLVSFCLVAAFARMPIATAIAIFFVEPLLLTLLAGPLLGEVPGPRRFAAVGVGLIGALIVIRPSFAEFGSVALLPLLGALAFALNMIVTRRATGTRSPLSFQLGASLWGAGLALAIQPGLALWDMETRWLFAMPPWVWGAVLAAAALVTVAFLAITFAFSKAEASLLAPFQYLEILGATAVGWLFFAEIPDGLTVLGASIILGSGLYVFSRERAQGAEAATLPPQER